MDGIRRSAGIDWATDGHAICVIDEHGSVLERYEVEHTGAGLRDLVHRLRVDRVSGIAIERPDGPVIDALFAAGLRVVVIASRHVKALRTRYGLSGNKDDRADAYILADVLRTDGHRLMRRSAIPVVIACALALAAPTSAQGPVEGVVETVENIGWEVGPCPGIGWGRVPDLLEKR